LLTFTSGASVLDRVDVLLDAVANAERANGVGVLAGGARAP
jgi:hypothetical protein